MGVIETYAFYRAFKTLVKVLKALGPILKESLLRDRTAVLFLRENQASVFLFVMLIIMSFYVVYLKETRPVKTTVTNPPVPLVGHGNHDAVAPTETQHPRNHDAVAPTETQHPPCDDNTAMPPVVIRQPKRDDEDAIRQRIRERFYKPR